MIAAEPLPEAIGPSGIAAALDAAGADLRLPTTDEWEAALRGPDGRPRPWGLAPRPGALGAASPWGAEPSPDRVGEWVVASGALCVMGRRPGEHIGWIEPKDAATRARIRPVRRLTPPGQLSS